MGTHKHTVVEQNIDGAKHDDKKAIRVRDAGRELGVLHEGLKKNTKAIRVRDAGHEFGVLHEGLHTNWG